MSAISKGNDREKLAKAILEADGYTVDRATRKAVYIKSMRRHVSQANDFFGCIDLIAVRPGSKIRFVQVTDQTHLTKHLPEMQAIPWPLEHCSVEVWAWHPGRPAKYKNTDKWKLSQVFAVFDITDADYTFRYYRLKDGDICVDDAAYQLHRKGMKQMCIDSREMDE